MKSERRMVHGKRQLPGRPRLSSTACHLLADEQGQALLLQTILSVLLLVLVIGLVYDLGAVALAQARAQDAADLAVQDAAKELNVVRFTAGQEVTLSQNALVRAQTRLAEYSAGQVHLTGLQLVKPDPAHTGIRLTGELIIRTRFLHLLGLNTITRRVSAIAVPAFGIAGEGQ